MSISYQIYFIHDILSRTKKKVEDYLAKASPPKPAESKMNINEMKCI